MSRQFLADGIPVTTGSATLGRPISVRSAELEGMSFRFSFGSIFRGRRRWTGQAPSKAKPAW